MVLIPVHFPPQLHNAATARRGWLVVASREHVQRGLREGIVQACHGKVAPLRRMQAGDTVICYSPTELFRGEAACRRFTAIGTVADEPPYPFDMGEGFVPWRRKVAWQAAQEVDIGAVRAQMSVFPAGPRWAAPLRFGFLALSPGDVAVLRDAMQSERAM